MAKIPNQIDNIELPFPNREALKESRTFYQQVFGWKFQEWGPEYLDTADSGISSGLAVSQLQTPLIIVYTDNIEQALESVKQAGGEITQELFEFPGGRRFQFRDPAGNELAFWSE